MNNLTITSLGDDILRETFAYLDYQSLANCRQVSKKWCEIASNDQLWLKLFPVLSFINTKICQSIGNYCIAKSEEEIILHFEQFVEKVNLNQKATFTCLFLLDEESKLEFQFMLLRNRRDNLESVESTCLFLKKSLGHIDSFNEDQGSFQINNPVYDENQALNYKIRKNIPVGREEFTNKFYDVSGKKILRLKFRPSNRTEQIVFLIFSCISASFDRLQRLGHHFLDHVKTTKNFLKDRVNLNLTNYLSTLTKIAIVSVMIIGSVACTLGLVI